MDDARVNFLKRLVASPSPSGFEQPAQQVVREEIQQFADEVYTDVPGNVIAALNPAGKPRVMLAAHCDELGFLIRYIDERGFLYFSPIGGFDPSTLPGERVYVHTPTGPILGVLGRKPIHLMESKERSQAPELAELWIDIGVENKSEAQELVPLGSRGDAPAPRTARSVKSWRLFCVLGARGDRRARSRTGRACH